MKYGRGLGMGKSSGKDQAKAATKAADIQAKAQLEALDYLKETEAIPQQYREQALKQLGGIFGGGQEQLDFINSLQDNPLYQAILGTGKAGEDSVLRNQAATGGFRSGDTQANLYQQGQQLQNKALLDTYNQQVSGIQGLAGLPSNVNQIASLTQGIGTTQAQGVVGAAAAKSQGGQQGFSQGLGLANLGLQAYSAFSDPRLKENVELLRVENGVKWYKWDWNEEAGRELGLTGSDSGVMATEHPDCTLLDLDTLYKKVDYSKIAKKMEKH